MAKKKICQSSSKFVLRSAASEAFRVIGSSFPKLGVSSLVLILGCGVYYIYLAKASQSSDPAGDVGSEFFVWLSFVAVPAAVLFSLVFLWQLWLTPYRLLAEQLEEKTEEFEQNANQELKELSGRIELIQDELRTIRIDLRGQTQFCGENV